MMLHIIADYGQGDLAFAEVMQRLQKGLSGVQPVLTNVPPFATLAAGFCIAQLALNDPAEGMIIYHNVAPRSDGTQPVDAGAGERLVFARLPNGVRVIGVNSGHSLSFIRDTAEELRWVNMEASKSQFRSRDVFPKAVATIASGNTEPLGDEIARSEIPDIPQNCLVYVDGYGNLKTTIPLEQSVTAGSTILQSHFNDVPGHTISVRIGEVKKTVVIGDASFDVKPGQMTLAPGSSGWTFQKGNGMQHNIRWMELFFRSGSAWEEFGRPPIGASIEITEDL
jgi:S-adenosylmethionine hydrolase